MSFGRATAVRFITDDQALRVGVVLDHEHRDVDLTGDRLGMRLLDALVLGMLDAHAAFRAPDGTPWPALARSTRRRKGHSLIGVHTGRTRITDPDLYRAMPRQILEREAWWYVPRAHPRWPQLHGWQNGIPASHVPARRLLGWTRGAQDQARRLIRQAAFQAGS
jgi:hypothetical protein